MADRRRRLGEGVNPAFRHRIVDQLLAAADAGDEPDRPPLRDQHGPLFDMRLEIGDGARPVDAGGAAAHRLRIYILLITRFADSLRDPGRGGDAKIGITPMNGVNDSKELVFTLDHAKAVTAFARATPWVTSRSRSLRAARNSASARAAVSSPARAVL